MNIWNYCHDLVATNVSKYQSLVVSPVTHIVDDNRNFSACSSCLSTSDQYIYLNAPHPSLSMSGKCSKRCFDAVKQYIWSCVKLLPADRTTDSLFSRRCSWSIWQWDHPRNPAAAASASNIVSMSLITEMVTDVFCDRIWTNIKMLLNSSFKNVQGLCGKLKSGCVHCSFTSHYLFPWKCICHL